MRRPRRRLAAVPVVAALLTAALLAPGTATAQGSYSPLSVSYSVGAAAVNSSRNLVITVNPPNPTMVGTFNFTVSLPNGFTRPTAPTTNCMSGSITSSPPFRSAAGELTPPVSPLYATGSMYLGMIPCTFTIPITSATEGTFSTCAANFSGMSMVLAPTSCGSIRFAVAHPARLRDQLAS
ncbi:hypothetical protein [Actinokineospora enzanensis]|uniref:hypothetical protein n=1 Tax=Actinokineospora enzanensis TaxID=155975 RepID=UPI00039F9190|nr:hypothetical protein [Actinokineospora enzanensis]